MLHYISFKDEQFNLENREAAIFINLILIHNYKLIDIFLGFFLSHILDLIYQKLFYN